MPIQRDCPIVIALCTFCVSKDIGTCCRSVAISSSYVIPSRKAWESHPLKKPSKSNRKRPTRIQYSRPIKGVYYEYRAILFITTLSRDYGLSISQRSPLSRRRLRRSQGRNHGCYAIRLSTLHIRYSISRDRRRAHGHCHYGDAPPRASRRSNRNGGR